MTTHSRIETPANSPFSDQREWARLESEIDALLVSADNAKTRGTLLSVLESYAQTVVDEARSIGASIPQERELDGAFQWLNRPVFVCGHHRSGTTLLQNLLDGHPDLLVLPSEGTHFTALRYAARNSVDRAAVDRYIREWVCRFIDANHEPHFKLGRTNAIGNPYITLARRILGWHEALVRDHPQWSRFGLLLALVASYRDALLPAATPSVWIEKTPLNELHVDRFADFRNARFVQVVREPKATLASLRRAYATASVKFDAARHARAIARSLSLAIRNQQRFRERYLVVRYEDLVSETDREMERVAKFLRISWRRSLLTPTVMGVTVSPNTSFPAGKEGDVHGTDRALADDEKLIGVFASAAARRFDYESRQPKLSTRAAVRMRHAPAAIVWNFVETLRRHVP